MQRHLLEGVVVRAGCRGSVDLGGRKHPLWRLRPFLPPYARRGSPGGGAKVTGGGTRKKRSLKVEPICRTLGGSASAYYDRASGRRSVRAVEDERLCDRACVT